MSTNDLSARAAAFLASRSFAVAGVSADPEKYGRKVYEALLASGRNRVYALNPRLAEIEGRRIFPALAALPEVPESLSIVTPPAATEQLVAEAARLGVRRIWMQPGAESPAATTAARSAGLEVIAGDACILVALSAERASRRASTEGRQ